MERVAVVIAVNNINAVVPVELVKCFIKWKVVWSATDCYAKKIVLPPVSGATDHFVKGAKMKMDTVRIVTTTRMERTTNKKYIIIIIIIF